MSGPLTCPKCGLSRIMKVSAVYSGEKSSGTAWNIEDSFGAYSLQSERSRKLAPPTQPSSASTTEVLGYYSSWVFVVLFGLVVIASILTPGTMEKYLDSFLVFAGGFLLSLFMTYNQKRRVNAMNDKAAAQMPAWEKAMGRWNELYYCEVDDGIFIPGESELVPIDQLMAYLYRK